MVVDASAAIDLYLRGPHYPWLREQIESALYGLSAPSLIEIEFTSALRRLNARKHLSDNRAKAALQDFQESEIECFEHGKHLERIWELRHHLTAYDATYVALAEALGMPLLTLDHRIAESPGLRCAVVLPTR